jgi:WD40 repeat protein
MEWTNFIELANKVLGNQPDDFENFSRCYHALNHFLLKASSKERKIAIKILASLAYQKTIDFKEATKYIRFIKSIEHHQHTWAPEVQYKKNLIYLSTISESSHPEISTKLHNSYCKHTILKKISAFFNLYTVLNKLQRSRNHDIFNIGRSQLSLTSKNTTVRLKDLKHAINIIRFYTNRKLSGIFSAFKLQSEPRTSDNSFSKSRDFSQFRDLFIRTKESISKSYLQLLICEEYINSYKLHPQEDSGTRASSRDYGIQTDILDSTEESQSKPCGYIRRYGSLDSYEGNAYLETCESHSTPRYHRYFLDDISINPFRYSPSISDKRVNDRISSNRTSAEVFSMDIFQSLGIIKLTNAINRYETIRLRSLGKGLQAFIRNVWRTRYTKDYGINEKYRSQKDISKIIRSLDHIRLSNIHHSFIHLKYLHESHPEQYSHKTNLKQELVSLKFEQEKLIDENTELLARLESCQDQLADYKYEINSLKNQLSVSKISVRYREPATIVCQQTHKAIKHNGWIYSIASSSDSVLAASGSADRSIFIWNINERKLIGQLLGHLGWVYAVAFSHDNRQLVSGGGDKTVRLWSLVHMKELNVFEGHVASVRCVAITRNSQFIISGSTDSTIRIWNTQNKNEHFTLKGHFDCVYSIALNSNDEILVSASLDCTIIIWSMISKSHTTTLYGHKDSIYSCILTSDDRYIISASADKTIRIWNLRSKSKEKVLKGHNATVFALSSTSDCKYLISSSMDNTMKIWNISTGKQELSLPRSSSGISCLSVTQDNSYILEGSDDMTLRMWSLFYSRSE